MRATFAGYVMAAAMLGTGVAAQDVTVHLLRQQVARPATLSNLDPVPEDDGIAGAALGLSDNATTGGFLGQSWTLEQTDVPEGGDFAAAVRDALTKTDLLVLDAPAEQLLQAADLPEAAGALLFNTSATDIALRGAECRANLLHTMPSRDMLTDALMQFFVLRQWSSLVMIEGPQPADHALADAYRASAQKFGMGIRRTQDWDDAGDLRRNASAEVPVFTQAFGKYDVLIVADEANDFARYIPYNTWMPRPVAGSEGLTPSAWAPVMEQWGAAQLQSRFHDRFGRDMTDRDYAAWAAIRSLGEAVTRTKASAAPDLRPYLLGEAFELAGFKGRALSFRPWNGQLRQPIPLTHRGAVVAVAPLDGFLHPVSELDTLGQDKPESGCTAFE